jgi:hypothetical protein
LLPPKLPPRGREGAERKRTGDASVGDVLDNRACLRSRRLDFAGSGRNAERSHIKRKPQDRHKGQSTSRRARNGNWPKKHGRCAKRQMAQHSQRSCWRRCCSRWLLIRPRPKTIYWPPPNNTLDVKVTNVTMGGDPNKGAEKTLKVDYTYRGQRQQVVVKEGDRLKLP